MTEPRLPIDDVLPELVRAIDEAGIAEGRQLTSWPSIKTDLINAGAEWVDQEVVEALITFEKQKPKPREPKAGLAVRKADAARAVLSGYLVQTDPIDVPTQVVEPAVDQEGLDEAMETIAEPAVSGPVVIKVGDKEVDLPVSAYAPALEIRVIDGAMKPHIDPETGVMVSGTLRTAAERLPAIARMGFDVVYLPPVHPIGTSFVSIPMKEKTSASAPAGAVSEYLPLTSVMVPTVVPFTATDTPGRGA